GRRAAGAAGRECARQIADLPRLVAQRPPRAGTARHPRAVAGGCRTDPQYHAGAACRLRSHRPSHRIWRRPLRPHLCAFAQIECGDGNWTCLFGPGNALDPRSVARRGAGFCANGKRRVRFPEQIGLRILFIGDVVGRTGRTAVSEYLPGMVKDWSLDLVIVNGENSAGGFGITEAIYGELLDAGADAITLGNHAWNQKEALVFIERAPRLIRPLNFPRYNPGRGTALIDTKNGKRALIINAMGRVFMEPGNDPFAAVDRELEACPLAGAADAIVFVFQGEAPSENKGMVFFCAGRVTPAAAPPPHVPTADHQILPGGTAYMSDAGMTGDYDSIIGMQKEEPMRRFTTGFPSARFEPAGGEATLSGVAVETDDATGFATKIAPVRKGGRLAPATPDFW